MLTQATFSFSREDAENKFLPLYNERGILQDNPFDVLDRKGVGKLMELAVQWGRERRPDLTVGICGEHGGHPDSIHFRCPPWRAKRRRVVPGSREATRDTRRAEGAKGDPKGASERGVQSYGRPVCSRNELAMLWRNAG